MSDDRRVVQFRVSPEEDDRLRANARAAGLSLSDYLKARGGAVEPEVVAKPRDGRSDRTPDEAEKARRREIRERRRRAAEANGVAIGWVNPDGTVQPGAPKMPKVGER
jgi:hypothetical protein